jgi:hypothetical protein
MGLLTGFKVLRILNKYFQQNNFCQCILDIYEGESSWLGTLYCLTTSFIVTLFCAIMYTLVGSTLNVNSIYIKS